MNVPPSDDLPRELLAAYADGELDATGCARVERWLTEHPEAQEELRAQREFSPGNTPLWDAAEPPELSAAIWTSLRGRIEAKLNPIATQEPRKLRPNRGWLLVTLTAAAAAVALLIYSSSQLEGPTPRPTVVARLWDAETIRAPEPGPEAAPAHPITFTQADPLTAVDVLPMASDDDVVLERVPALRSGWLPSGQHPVPGVLELASVDDVHLEDVSPSPAWPTQAGPKMTTAPGDAPMIFAAKPR